MATETEKARRKLVPIWIKVFGWLFIVMGIAVPIMPIAAPFFDRPATYEIFGLEHVGSPFHPMALLISAIILTLSVSAYGLLFGKSWGLKACLITGYGGIVISLLTMVYSLTALNVLSLRLELLIQIPYLIKLHKIRSHWS